MTSYPGVVPAQGFALVKEKRKLECPSQVLSVHLRTWWCDTSTERKSRSIASTSFTTHESTPGSGTLGVPFCFLLRVPPASLEEDTVIYLLLQNRSLGKRMCIDEVCRCAFVEVEALCLQSWAPTRATPFWTLFLRAQMGSGTRQCTKVIVLHTDVNVGRLSHQWVS